MRPADAAICAAVQLPREPSLVRVSSGLAVKVPFDHVRLHSSAARVACGMHDHR
jgi:hypothetical protein